MFSTQDTRYGPPQPLPDVGGVATALQQLKHEEVEISGTTIEKIERSEHGSLDQHKGIDFKVYFKNGVVVPLKVKASHRAAHRFHRQGHEKPFQIPVIVARIGYERLGHVIRELVSILRSAFVVFKRMRDKIIFTERHYRKTGGYVHRSFCPA